MSSPLLSSRLQTAAWCVLPAAAVAALLHWFASGQTSRADALSALGSDTVATIAKRADAGGDAGMGAIRGAVVLVDPKSAIEVPGVHEPVAMLQTETAVRKMGVVNGKLVEKTSRGATSTSSVEWLVHDSTGSASVAPSIGAPKLRACPSAYEPVTDEGSLEIGFGRAGSLEVHRSTERERIIGIERTPYVLTAGTMLTVVGRATLDSRGGLRFVAGSGLLPSLVSTQTLGEIIDSYNSAASSLRAVGWVVLGAGVLLAVIGAAGGFDDPPAGGAADAGSARAPHGRDNASGSDNNKNHRAI